jgi:hypothetical protein
MRKVMAVAAAVLVLGGSGAMAQGPSGSNGQGPDANGPAKFGLCKAYFSGNGGENGKRNDAPPFRNLAEAAEANDQTIEEFCANATPGGR